MSQGASSSVMMLAGSALGFILAGMLLALLGATREWILKMFPRLMSVLKSYPGKKDAEQNHRVYTELVEVRALANADRSYVLRFHNGSDFLPDNPVWKVTSTHEIVKPGVSYGSSGIQSILVSRIHGIVDPIITGESRYKGIKVVDCSKCSFKEECERIGKYSVVVHVDEMEDSFARFLLESHNVKTVVASGMVSGRKAFGMVTLDFCDRKLDSKEETDAVAKACKTAGKMQYYLQFKSPPIG